MVNDEFKGPYSNPYFINRGDPIPEGRKSAP